MRAAVRQIILTPPPWTRPEMYYTDDTTGATPYVVDGRLNLLSGLDDLSGSAIPSAVLIFPSAATRNGDLSGGQSNDTGNMAQTGDSAASASYEIKMFNGGLKAAPAGNAYSATLTGTTSLVQLAESNDSAFGFTLEGETHHTTALVGMCDLALSGKSIALLDNKWVTSCCAKNGIAIAGRVQGSTLWNYITDQIRAQNSLVGAGYALRVYRNFDQEADAIGTTTQAVF